MDENFARLAFKLLVIRKGLKDFMCGLMYDRRNALV